MRRFLLTVATAATALTATACSDVTGIRRDLEGTYVLETVNGAGLPEYVSEIDGEFLSGEVTLYNDGTYEDEIRIRYTGNNFVTRFPSSGTYTISGDRPVQSGRSAPRSLHQGMGPRHVDRTRHGARDHAGVPAVTIA